MFMTRDELISKMRETANQKPRPVDVPAWGTVYVRKITVGEIDEQTEDTGDKRDRLRFARAAARVMCDADGQRLFDPEDGEDVDLLARQPWDLLRAVIIPSENPGN